jgi:plasmid maintenance system antidote protein VapI
VTALQLEDVLGVPAEFWLNLELDYQLAKARLARARARRPRMNEAHAPA